MQRFRALTCFESCELQFSYNMRLRWTEEKEFPHLSNHGTFLAFLQDFNLVMPVFHL